MIDGVHVKKLKPIADERGKLMEILRCDDPFFHKFGQVYLTTAYPGVVKAWHYHKRQADHFCVVKGMMKVALYDARESSPTHGEVNEFFLGEDSPLLLVIPPGVYHGMKAIGTEQAYLVNCPTEPYNHAESDECRIDPFENDIPYDWRLKHG
jgi:dTDP-4-dehydrorhamnose 3,5-epimerase